MARLATLLVEKARRVRHARGAGIHDQTIINGVNVRRNKYDTGFVFSHGSTGIYIDDEPTGIEDDNELFIIAEKMLTVQDILTFIHKIVLDDIHKAIQLIS